MTNADQLYQNALSAFHNGDTATSALVTAQALTHDRVHGAAHLLRAASLAPSNVALIAAHYAAATRLSPLSAEHWFNRGVFLESHGRIHEAVNCYRRAIQLDPLHLGALVNGTQLIRVTESFEEALHLARRLQQLDPNGHLGHAHEAICLQHLGRLEESDAVFDEAIRRSPDPTLLHWEHHFSHLVRGNFAEAWKKYEVRFACGYANGVSDMAFTLPRWDGAPGQHVLVYGEQGLGDQIMFASALHDLAAICASVSLAISPVLVELFRASFPNFSVVAIHDGANPDECATALDASEKGAKQKVDAVLPIGSLMTHFRNQASDFDGKPFLKPSNAAIAHWKKRKSGRKTAKTKDANRPIRLGICWASNPAPERFFSSRRALHKTMPLDQMRPLVERENVAALAVTNVSLDMFEADAKVKAQVEDVSTELTNLDRTAALMQGLDLVITVDTGIAHLAGALGVPVWILLHKAGDARWGQSGSKTSYWYNSARLFWQSEPGNWTELIERVGHELDVLIKNTGSGE